MRGLPGRSAVGYGGRNQRAAAENPRVADYYRGQHSEARPSYKFKNFVDAIAFTDAVGAAAEEEGHHPRLTTEWGKVAVTWWTHKIKNLHKNDFIMAAKTDAIYRKFA